MLRTFRMLKEELELISSGAGFCVYPLEDGYRRPCGVLAHFYETIDGFRVLKTIDASDLLNDYSSPQASETIVSLATNKYLLEHSSFSLFLCTALFARIVVPCNEVDFHSFSIIYLD